MGRASAGKDDRRRILRNLREDLERKPEIAAKIEETRSDRDLRARWRADFPEQARRLERAGWRQVREAGDGGGMWAHPGERQKLIFSVMRWDDGNLWGHISLSSGTGRLPGWQQLSEVHRLLYPDYAGVQVIPPVSQHVTYGEIVHAWTCLTAAVIPDFGRFGTI